MGGWKLIYKIGCLLTSPHISSLDFYSLFFVVLGYFRYFRFRVSLHPDATENRFTILYLFILLNAYTITVCSASDCIPTNYVWSSRCANRFSNIHRFNLYISFYLLLSFFKILLKWAHHSILSRNSEALLLFLTSRRYSPKSWSQGSGMVHPLSGIIHHHLNNKLSSKLVLMITELQWISYLPIFSSPVHL